MRRMSERSHRTEGIVEQAAIDPSPYIARGRMLHAEAVHDVFAHLLHLPHSYPSRRLEPIVAIVLMEMAVNEELALRV